MSNPQIGIAGKRYGLTIRKKRQGTLSGRKRPASQISTSQPLKGVFGLDDDDDGDGAESTPRSQEEVNRMLAAGGGEGSFASLRQRRREKELEQVLMQDETAYEYDTLYDSFQESRAAAAKAHQEEKRRRESRYIEDLLKQAEFREKEHNIIYERRLLKEREKEDELYGDKERFITSAYKKKLLEDELWKKQQAEKDARDRARSAEAVAEKTGGLGMAAFHANLLRTGGHSRSALAEPARKLAEERRTQREKEREREKEEFLASRGRGTGTQRRDSSSSPARKDHSRSRSWERASPSDRRAARDGGRRSRGDRETKSRSGSSDDARGREGEDMEALPEDLEAARRAREDRAKAARERYLARRRERQTAATQPDSENAGK